MDENKFEWTETLINEYAERYRYHSGRYSIEDFIKLKLAPPPVNERIEVNVRERLSSESTIRTTAIIITPNMGQRIPQDKFPAIKLLLERFLNNEFRVHTDYSWSVHSENQKTFTEKDTEALNEDTVVPDKDWEIQGIEYKGKNYWVQKDGLYNSDLFGTHLPYRWFIANGGKIFSVLRKYDGNIFSIGDFIKVKKYGERKGWSDTIQSFLIEKPDAKMIVEFETWRQPLNDIERMHKEIKVTTPPQPTAADTGKEGWEILTCFDNGIKYWKEGKDWHEYISTVDKFYCTNCDTDKCKIRSVRRLSDNQVITVGDIDHNGNKIKEIRKTENLGVLIFSNDGTIPPTMLYAYKPQGANEKLPPKEQSKPILFTTEDGVEIISGIEWYTVDKDFFWWHSNNLTCEVGNKYFSTKELAEQYILENKPVLSLKDLKGLDYGAYNLVKQLVKEKLKA